MNGPRKHVLVCASFRAAGAPQGACAKKGSGSLLAHLEEELSDRGLDDVVVTATGCLKFCDRGAVMVVHPDNLWYGGIGSEDDVDAIIDSIESGEPAAKFLIK